MQLNDEQTMIQDAARNFARDRLAPQRLATAPNPWARDFPSGGSGWPSSNSLIINKKSQVAEAAALEAEEGDGLILAQVDSP